MANEKLNAARAALMELPEHGTIGLGTGSTASLFIHELAGLVHAGRRYVGVPTSQASEALATSLGIPLLDGVGPWDIDINVDGADEVSETFDLIKGGGSAHARNRERFGAPQRHRGQSGQAVATPPGRGSGCPSRCCASDTGRRPRISHDSAVRACGCRSSACPSRRTEATVSNLAVAPINEVRALDAALSAIPGVVETGLFVGRADVVIVGDESGVRRLVKTPAPS